MDFLVVLANRTIKANDRRRRLRHGLQRTTVSVYFLPDIYIFKCSSPAP
jgi:hypothetical protein